MFVWSVMLIGYHHLIVRGICIKQEKCLNFLLPVFLPVNFIIFSDWASALSIESSTVVMSLMKSMDSVKIAHETKGDSTIHHPANTG